MLFLSFKRLLLSWAWLSLVAAPTTSASGVALQDLPLLLQQRNFEVLQRDAAHAAAQAEADASRAAFFPSLEWHGRLTRLDQDVVLSVPPQRIERPIADSNLVVGLDIELPSIKVQDRLVPNSYLLLTQPLYTGGRLSAQHTAKKASVQVAASERDAVFNDSLAEALERYFQAQLAALVSERLLSVQAHLQEIRRIAVALVAQGVVPEFSLLQLEVAEAELAAKLTQAQTQERLVHLALRALIGVDNTVAMKLTSPLRKVPLPAGREDFKLAALRHRSEFRLLAAKKQQADALRTAATGAMLPTVYTFGKYELLDEYLTALQPKWAVGVGFSLPLHAPLEKLAERRQAAELAKQVSIMEDKARTLIPLEVERYIAESEMAASSLNSLEAAVTTARRANHLAKVRFQNGQGSSLEVLKSLTDLERVEIQYLQVLELYNRQLIAVYRAMGRSQGYIETYAAN